MDAEIFLTTEEARDAVSLDLEQYGLQEETLREMADLAGGAWPSRFRVALDVKEPQGEAILSLMRDLMAASGASLELFCGLLSVLFWCDVCPGFVDGDEGVVITTELEGFTCLGCGVCCKNLDYSRALISDDIEMWKRAGRQDILSWVGRDKDGGYIIWVDPKTGKLQDPCPFLVAKGDQNLCGIHEMKPSICREYPATKKHGFMTGCPGVEKMFASELAKSL
ncbi:MAG: YkgJ family cysteine cluster protein [Desulfobacterales bacterium]|nr:YkgJ family cysteine cluster protein [Desulfobacterales bacterium]